MYDIRFGYALLRGVSRNWDERRKCEKLNMDTSVCGGGCRSVAVAFFD
jgi:hypothetical protein